MTDIDIYQDRSPAVDARTEAVHRLGEWAASAQAAYNVAEQLVKTSFVPEGFRGKPYEATAAILAGIEIGLSPMASLRSFDVIQGQAAARAITLRAVVQSHGHEIELLESSDTKCKMRGRRRGATTWTPVTWHIDRARHLGLTSKQNWKTQPQAMLIARATSELARLIAADAILGIGYSAEEIADGAAGEVALAIAPAADSDTGQTDAEQATATPGKKRMSRKGRTPEQADVDSSDDTADGPSSEQTAKAMASFGEAGFGDRDDRLAATSAFIGRTVESWKDVTSAEASTVIDGLERFKAGDLTLAVNEDGWAFNAAEDAAEDDGEVDVESGDLFDEATS